MRQRITPGEFLRKNWLLSAILGCIFLAGLFPELGSKQGPLKTEYSVKYGAVSLMFLISGFSLKTDTVWRTFRRYKLHLFIQLFTFLFIPIFTQCFVKILAPFGINGWVLKGLITVACMPPPVSSAVILTRAAQGNETAAIFNSLVGSFLGILITPLSLLFNLGSTTIVPLFSTIAQLTTTVLLPLVLGQMMKVYGKLPAQRIPLNTVSQCALLFVIYTTFCDTFLVPETGLSALDVIVTIFSGIPILRVMFHGYSHLSQISLPLLVYHPTQIILGGLMVSHLKDWLHSHKTRKLPV